MKKILFMLVMLSMYCLPSNAQSQTRTAFLFNNFNGFDDPYVNNWVQNEPALVSADDNVYAYSKKLSKRAYLSLSLKDFRFEIPANAVIGNITVSARRFKTGTGSIRDYFATLNIVSNTSPGLNNPYGVRWTDPSLYPSTETQVNYSQAGSGSNGGLYANQVYQWTPTMINNQAFGVRIDTYEPAGSVVVYFDYVQITVEYSVPQVITSKGTGITEINTLKTPVVYPNPFTTNTNIQFTAAENGNAFVELYNIAGAKLKILFSGNVMKGQSFNVVAGSAQLPKGIYIYKVNNGTQMYAGRIVKLE